MQAKFYKTALTLDQKHSILMNSPLALCHDFFGGFIVALACVALWRGHMRCRILTSFLLTAPLVTEMHVDERTGMCLLLLLKSLYPRASSQRRGVPPRLCVVVAQAMRSVRWPQCSDCGRRACTCRRRALPDLSPASSFSEELPLGHTAIAAVLERRGWCFC